MLKQDICIKCSTDKNKQVWEYDCILGDLSNYVTLNEIKQIKNPKKFKKWFWYIR